MNTNEINTQDIKYYPSPGSSIANKSKCTESKTSSKKL